MSQSESAPTPESEPVGAPSPQSKYLQLGLAAVLGALVVLLVIVLLSSPDDHLAEPVNDGEQQTESLAEHAAPTIQLAAVPQEVSNEQLQEELLREVQTLCEEQGDVPQALHVAASAYDKLHQTAEADRLWHQCIALEPRYPGPRVGLAKLLSENGKDVEAIELLETALEEGVTTAELYYRLATAHSKVGHVERAEQVMKVGVAVFPDVAINWLLLGQTQNQLQKFAEAEKSLRKAIELGREDSTVYFALGNSCRRQKKLQEAKKYLAKFSELKEQETGSNEDKPFQEIYQQALRPVLVGTYSSSAAIYAAHGDAERAEQLLLRANQLEPKDEKVLAELVSLYRKQDRLSDARLVQQRMVELQPESAALRVNLANIMSQLGAWQSAVAELEEARRLSPNSPVPLFGLAQALTRLGDFATAREHAEAVVKLAPSPESYALLAIICEQMGDVEAAQDASKSAQQIMSVGR